MSWLSVCTASASESTPLPLPSENSGVFSMGDGVWRVFFALVVVVGIILLIRWFVSRVKNGSAETARFGKSIKIIERKPLGSRQSLLLVQVCDKKVLLHQSKGAMTPLCEVENSDGEG